MKLLVDICLVILPLVIGIVIAFSPLSYGMNVNIQNGTTNPCEYMNVQATQMNKLDTGDDANFERIKQQNNRDLIRACQEYQIQVLRTAQSKTY